MRPRKNSSSIHGRWLQAVSSVIFLLGLNGLDLQKRVAAERSDMPIVFITGYGDVPKTVQAMKAGASKIW